MQKIATLESKIKKIETERHNSSAINMGGERESNFEKANFTTVHFSENKKFVNKEEEEMGENKRLRSDIPMISSKTELYKI